MNRRFLFGAAIASMALVQSAHAQTPLYTSPPPPWINSAGPAEFVSPDVQPDRKVAFHIKAPTAQEVILSIGSQHADLHTYPMTKDAKGVWSTSVGPIDPGIYSFSYRIGGASVPQCNTEGCSSFEVKGATPAVYDVQNVPHGFFGRIYFQSKALGRSSELGVYLPAQYFSEPTRRFPVLYSWDGVMYEEGADGRQESPYIMPFQPMLDNMIAQKKAVPMIVVFMSEDSGRTFGGAALDSSLFKSGKAAETARLQESAEVADDIIPYVESHFRTLPGRQNRGIVGISHAGGATWTVGTNNLDKFGNLGLLSSGMFGGLLPRPGDDGFALYPPWKPDEVLPPVTRKMKDPATKLKVFYMAAGDIDPRVIALKSAQKDFQRYGVNPIVEVFPGGHQEKAFIPMYVSFVSKLFR